MDIRVKTCLILLLHPYVESTSVPGIFQRARMASEHIIVYRFFKTCYIGVQQKINNNNNNNPSKRLVYLHWVLLISVQKGKLESYFWVMFVFSEENFFAGPLESGRSYSNRNLTYGKERWTDIV